MSIFYLQEGINMLARQDYMNNITSKLALLKSKVELTNCINLYDINIHAEDFFCKLLNLVFNYNLINLNTLERNTSSIDLGDDSLKISVQVTSDNSSSKIHKTISKFIEYEYYKTYDRLIIFLLTDKRNYTTQFNTYDYFSFDKNTDILDIKDLIKIISKKDIANIEQINTFINSEFSNAQNLTDIKQSLCSMEQKVVAMCRSKLKAIGLSTNTIDTIINNDLASDKYSYIITAAENNKIYLTGDFGSGKSHALLISYLKMVNQYFSGEIDYIPLFILASDISKHGSIQNWVNTLCTSKKIFIFIDGLDEVAYDNVQKITSEISLLSELWPESKIIVGSRQMCTFINTSNSIEIQELSEEEQCKIISLITGYNRQPNNKLSMVAKHKWDKILTKPFYCILFALFEADSIRWAKTEIDLISEFINNSIGKLKYNNKSVLLALEEIAIRAVNKNFEPILIYEIDLDIEIEELVKTGFISLSDDNYYVFPLTIIAEWLASEAIRQKKIYINDILDNKSTAYRWRYTLSILFTQLTYDESKNIFSELVLKMPGLAAIIIRDGIRFGNSIKLPSPFSCGIMIRYCMEIWCKAVGPLAELIAPISNNKLHNLAIDVANNFIITTWANKPDEEDIVVLHEYEQYKWFSITNGRTIPAQNTWPWIVTFEYLSNNLTKIIKNKNFLLKDSKMEYEYIWKTTLILLNKGSLYQGNISINDIERFRNNNKPTHSIKGIDIKYYFSLVDKLKKKEINKLQPLLPLADKSLPQSGGNIWCIYSSSKLLECLSYIYKHALLEYQNLVNNLFCSLKELMPLYSLLPGEFVGYLNYDESNTDMLHMPILTWYIMALPDDSTSKTNISLDEFKTDYKSYEELITNIYKNIPKYRPSKIEWLSANLTSQVFHYDLCTPITHIVYEWLKKDLEKIGWIKK